MTNALDHILDLADADARMFELSMKMKRIPERLAEAKKHLAAEQVQFDEVNGPWSEADHKIREKEATIQIALETIEKFEEHMTRVTTQKEYMAAKKQVEEARKLNERLQNEILELRVKQEELAPRLAEVKERYDRVREDYEAQESVINEEQARLQGLVDEQQARIEAVADKVDNRVRGHFERLLKAKKRPCIVPVVATTCTGCNMAMMPQAYNQLCAHNGEFYTCPNCHRMLFIAPEVEQGAEEAEATESDSADDTTSGGEAAAPESAELAAAAS